MYSVLDKLSEYIGTFTYQKKLLHTLFCLFLNPSSKNIIISLPFLITNQKVVVEQHAAKKKVQRSANILINLR